MPTGSIGIDKCGIGRVLADGNLVVPQYQRSYAWEKQNVLEFLDDLERAVRGEAPEYFLGSIVLAHPNGSDAGPEVVDGQQRLATTTILLAGIRDYFRCIGDTRHQDIDGQYLMNRDLRNKDDVQKLSLNERDNNYFLNAILRPASPSPLPHRDSHRAMELARRLVSERVQKLVASTGSPDILIEFVLYLKDCAKVIVLTVPSDENAFMLFETLNDRGLDLALSDLLKNFLFRTAGYRLSEVRDAWVSMCALFEASGTEGLVVDFIRQMYSSRHGLTREKELFAEIKKQVVGKQNAVDFANELQRHAVLYQALISSDHPYWKKFPQQVARHIATLNFLGLTRIRPLLLAVLDQFAPKDIEVCLKRTVSWAVRLLVSGSLGSGTLEDIFSQRAKEIRDKIIPNVEALSKAIEAVVPTDPAFTEAFLALSITKNKVARYLLPSLERQARGEVEPELVVNDDPSELNLEHVLPQSPESNWPNVTPEEAAAYAYRIGNMVLLKKSENETLGSGSFGQKTSTLAASSLELTREVASNKSWGPKEIKTRQENLAKLAVKAWPLR